MSDTSNPKNVNVEVEMPLTRSQRRTLNKMAHQRAIHLFSVHEYKERFKASQLHYQVLYKKMMGMGFPFEEISELIKEPKLVAAISKRKSLHEMRDKLLTIPTIHPYSRLK